MNGSIPDKKYFKIGEVSNIVGVKPYVLRFWESEFECIKPKKDAGNQRLYSKNDIESILDVKHLLYEKKFTISGAKNRLKDKKLTVKEEMTEVLKRIKKDLEDIRTTLLD